MDFKGILLGVEFSLRLVFILFLWVVGLQLSSGQIGNAVGLIERLAKPMRENWGDTNVQYYVIKSDCFHLASLYIWTLRSADFSEGRISFDSAFFARSVGRKKNVSLGHYSEIKMNSWDYTNVYYFAYKCHCFSNNWSHIRSFSFIFNNRSGIDYYFANESWGRPRIDER